MIGELVVYRAQAMQAELSVLHGSGTADAAKLAADLYAQRYDQTIREPHIRIGATAGGAITGGRPSSKLWQR